MAEIVQVNPWEELPSAAPFVLPADKLLVDKFNSGES